MENCAMSVQKIVEVSAINILNIIFSSLIICLPGYQHINKRIRVFTLSYLIFVIAMAGVGQWMVTLIVSRCSSRIVRNMVH